MAVGTRRVRGHTQARDEQVEEEENATNIIDNLKMLNGNGYGIFMMDKDLAARVYTQAAPLAGKA